MRRYWMEVAVGVFILAAIAAFMMLALKVSGLSDSTEESTGYTLVAIFHNSGGLKPKAKVTIAGVSVGRVQSIELDPKNYLANVKMNINPKRAGQLPVDTRAGILTAGLLGDNYIGLVPGFSEEFLKSGDIIPETQTNSAIVLEDLISKFVSGQASQSSQENGDKPASPSIHSQ